MRLGVISNCFAEDVVAWPRSPLASRFDCAVFSFEVGRAKPDPAIYLEASRRLGVSAADTWFIGDGQDDELPGAEEAGLRAFQALWFLKWWSHFREPPSSVLTLSRIEEIPAWSNNLSHLSTAHSRAPSVIEEHDPQEAVS